MLESLSHNDAYHDRYKPTGSRIGAPPELATFMMAWQAKRFKVIASPALIDEYERVLRYPEVATRVFPELLRSLRSHLIDDIEIIAAPELIGICRDADDDKVIAAALFGMIDYLVTADSDLKTPEIVTLLADTGVEIVSMDELIKILD